MYDARRWPISDELARARTRGRPTTVLLLQACNTGVTQGASRLYSLLTSTLQCVCADEQVVEGIRYCCVSTTTAVTNRLMVAAIILTGGTRTRPKPVVTCMRPREHVALLTAASNARELHITDYVHFELFAI